jgi:hypothetical protein
MRRVLVLTVVVVALLAVGSIPAQAQGSCQRVSVCQAGCYCPHGLANDFRINCGAGWGPGGSGGCTDNGGPDCGKCVACWMITRLGTYTENSSCCNDSCRNPSSLEPTTPQRLACLSVPAWLAAPPLRREPIPPPDAGFTYALDEVKGGTYTLTLAKPAVAALVDLVYSTPDGEFVVTSKYDNLLRAGNKTIKGPLPGVQGLPLVSTKLRIWYVEYEDGSTEGELGSIQVAGKFEPLREAVKKHARRYAAKASSEPDTIEQSLTAEKPETSLDKIALAVIKATLSGLEGSAIGEQLGRLSR